MDSKAQLLTEAGIIQINIMNKITDGYHIVRATPKDNERILDFMRRNFFKDEPLNVAVGLMDDVETCPELENFCLETLKDGLSLIAESTDPDKRVVGACLNGLHEPGDLQHMDAEAEACPNPKFRKILQLLAAVERRADVFGKNPDVKQCLEIRIVAVDNAWRGRGIATRILNATRKLAGDLGFPLIKVDCTSHFSALAMNKLGGQCVFSMKYDDYVSRDSGEPVFQPEPPHLGVKTFVIRVAPEKPTILRREGEVLDR